MKPIVTELNRNKTLFSINSLFLFCFFIFIFIFEFSRRMKTKGSERKENAEKGESKRERDPYYLYPLFLGSFLLDLYFSLSF